MCSIVGQLSACPGWTLVVHDSTATGVSSGGTWTSSNPSVATVMLGFGQITSVSPGTTIITYSGSSGMSTAVFTVNPAPAPITSSSFHVCTGSSITLSHPSTGGVWSTSGPEATVTSTGIVTGVSANANVGVTYTLSPGCRSSVTVTVDPATASARVGTQICPSGTGAWVGYPSGGVWASSNPSVATIDPATGVMTGVSVGTTIVTYNLTNACGLVQDTAIGHISGTLNLPGFWDAIWSSGPDMRPGENMTLSVLEENAGGVWTSSAPSIASVTGYPSTSMFATVDAHSVGTAQISYTISNGTCPSISIVKSVDVSNDCISGKVLFSGSGGPSVVKVWLIKYDPVTHLLTAVDSGKIGTYNRFTFCNLGTDSFRLKASYDSLLAGTGAQPTYYTSSAFWNSASVIYHIAGTDDTGKNIVVTYGTVASGPGLIEGDVTTGANKGTTDYVPAPNVWVYCIDNATGIIMKSAQTDAAGHYFFGALPVGKTYKIYPEEMNYVTTPFPPISLTYSTTSMTAAHFRKHSISHTFTPMTTNVIDQTNLDVVRVFPVPAKNILTMEWQSEIKGMGVIEITDVLGRKLISSKLDISLGKSDIDISMLSPGIYILSFKTGQSNYTARIVVD
ncbi:MAG: T9SS type A sorting domain-containing protein [Chitinophagaceae bacterium]|nr:T9SS type A sorting domain-containing protein [Chitinophagaceae bacterium]